MLPPDLGYKRPSHIVVGQHRRGCREEPLISLSPIIAATAPSVPCQPGSFREIHSANLQLPQNHPLFAILISEGRRVHGIQHTQRHRGLIGLHVGLQQAALG